MLSLDEVAGWLRAGGLESRCVYETHGARLSCQLNPITKLPLWIHPPCTILEYRILCMNDRARRGKFTILCDIQLNTNHKYSPPSIPFSNLLSFITAIQTCCYNIIISSFLKWGGQPGYSLDWSGKNYSVTGSRTPASSALHIESEVC
jgi:hypothetical protein